MGHEWHQELEEDFQNEAKYQYEWHDFYTAHAETKTQLPKKKNNKSFVKSNF